MTDFDLATRAKTGDPAAVNELLRQSLPEVRGIVRSTLLRVRKTFDVFDGATAEALCAVWRSLHAWDPSRAPLVGFARTNIVRAVLRHAADMGHAVAIPDQEAAGEAFRTARHASLKRASSMEADLTPLGEPLVDAIPNHEHVDPTARHDAARILSRFSEGDVGVLMAHACGETNADIAQTMGCSREWAGRVLGRALHRARVIAGNPLRRAA